MAFDDDIPYQPPQLIDDELLYCETGTLLALQFLRVAHAVVEQAHVRTDDDLREAVHIALADLLAHRRRCENCREI
jgi:hypothetical protein